MSEEFTDEERKRIDIVVQLIGAALEIERESSLKTAGLIIYISTLLVNQENPNVAMYKVLKAIFLTVSSNLDYGKKEERKDKEDFPFWQPL